jgi:hypothetical protein
MLLPGRKGLESTVWKLLSRADAALKDKVGALRVHQSVHVQRVGVHFCKYSTRTHLWLYETSIASQTPISGPISHSTRHGRGPASVEGGRSYCGRQKPRKPVDCTRGIFDGRFQEQGAGGGQ